MARKLGAVAIAITSVALLPAGASAAAGDIYLADEDAALGGITNGAIFRIGPAGGEATPIASSSTFSNPSGMALDRNGQLLVADYTGDPQLLLVNPASGAISTFLAGEPPDTARDVAFGPDGTIYVTDSGDPGGVYRIDPATRATSSVASGPDLSFPWGLAVTRGQIAYIGDRDGDRILRLDLNTGQLTSLVSTPGLFGSPEVLMLSPDERFLYVADSATDLVVRIDLPNSSSSFVSVPDARGLALLRDGSLLVSDVEDNSIIRVTAGGALGGTFSADPDLSWPHDMVVEPDRCAGLVPTVVGTDAAEVINGSQFADVISTLGGADTVRSGGGKDVVCGGAGKDKLNGGAAKDRLFGQAGKDKLKGGKGKDKLVGGKGKDVCAGGKGADKGKGCESGTL